MRERLSRLLDWTRRDRLARELAEEMEFRRRQLERDAIADGATPAEARIAARRRPGNRTRIAEDSRDRWSWPAPDAVLQDGRYALRGLRRAPGFTAAVVLTLSLGIGANAAMFGVLDRLMARPLPLLRDPESVHRIYQQWNTPERVVTRAGVSFGGARDLRTGTSSFSQVAVFTDGPRAVGIGEDVRERRVSAVSASWFGFFDATPSLGRFFTESEDMPLGPGQSPAGADVAVLSHTLWLTAFGGRTDVLGERIHVGDVALTVIGVAPPGLTGMDDTTPTELFMPVTTGMRVSGTPPPGQYRYGFPVFQMIARLREGVTAARAAAEATLTHRRSWEAQRAEAPRSFPVAIGPAAEVQARIVVGAVRQAAGPNPRREARVAVWVAGVAGIVLLIACANVANLLLARVARRRRETVVRVALGAGRSHLVAQAATEIALLGTLSLACGLAIAQVVGRTVHALVVPDATVRFDALADWRTLGASIGIAAAVCVLTGVAPVLIESTRELAGTLRIGARSAPARRSPLRGALLVVQGALSVTLLIGALLFVRSLSAVRDVPMGIDFERVVAVEPVARGMAGGWRERVPLHRALLEAAQQMPEVEAAALLNGGPFWATGSIDVHVDGRGLANRLGELTYQSVTPGYFDMAGVRLVRGRTFTDADRAGAPRVALVSESMARTVWPGRDPIGECVRLRADTMPCTAIVGVVRNVVISSARLDPEAGMQFYVPFDQDLQPSDLFVKLRPDAMTRVDALRLELQRQVPALSLTAQPVHRYVLESERPWQLGAAMFSAFGVLALVVAAVGLYGVVSYDVAQRAQELAVRAALGARGRDLLRHVLTQGLQWTVMGIACGIALAFLAARHIEPLLFGQSSRDPAIYAAVTVILLLVAVAASTGPALRAARSDPNAALRGE